jgi:hypothetical protein
MRPLLQNRIVTLGAHYARRHGTRTAAGVATPARELEESKQNNGGTI